MRRPADVLAQDLQHAQMLQRQAAVQRLILDQRKSLPGLIAASRRKSLRRHHVDEAEVKAHQSAVCAEQRELRDLESIGPAQLLLEAVDEIADELMEESVELVVDGLCDGIEEAAEFVVDEVDEVAGELAEDFLHLAHLD